MASCNASLAACTAELNASMANYTALEASYAQCGCGVDPCAAVLDGSYDLGLHIGAIFIILSASSLGVAIPLFARRWRTDAVSYFIALGKAMSIGIILACSLVHMLLPAQESLTSVCVPASFNTDYTAYAYLFAMLAALGMHFLDYVLLRALNKRYAQHSGHGHGHGHSHGHSHGVALDLLMMDSKHDAAAAAAADGDHAASLENGEIKEASPGSEENAGRLRKEGSLEKAGYSEKAGYEAQEGNTEGTVNARVGPDPASLPPSDPSDPSAPPAPVPTKALASATAPSAIGLLPDGMSSSNGTISPSSTPTPQGKTVVHMHHGGGHVHAAVPLQLQQQQDGPSVQKKIAAYMLEFGVTVHSVFIGLAVGVVGESALTGLLVALVFHQFFEGVALGARLADAKMRSHWNEFILGLIFSVAAPLGIAIGIGVATSLDPNSQTYLLVQGSFDAICAGILLYIGFDLLFHDFPEDMEANCADRSHETLRRCGLFFALWIGAGAMAFLGRYL